MLIDIINSIDKNNSWRPFLKKETEKPYFTELSKFLETEYETKTIFPRKENIFRALNLTPYNDVKIVILGQDPYHGEVNGQPQANGLAFSVNEGIPVPPSLKNIFKELNAEAGGTGFVIPSSGDLSGWAKKHILLLNTSLTVEKDKPNSHKGLGWEIFTDYLISCLNEKSEPIVFMLWGNNAKAKVPLLNNPKHLVLTAPHPSPFSANYGFFGCNHFRKAKAFLQT